jgi:hypothetical protein
MESIGLILFNFCATFILIMHNPRLGSSGQHINLCSRCMNVKAFCPFVPNMFRSLYIFCTQPVSNVNFRN